MSTARLLTIALVVQLALAVITWWPQDRSATLPHPLLDLPADAITSVAIATAPEAGGSAVWLELSRGEDGWVVASEQDYPANPAAVAQLLERLLGLKVGPPIATRAATHNALKVGEDEYGRRVRIGTAEGERELVLGAARSNSVNVRLADSDDVYVASGLSEWSLQESPDSYWNDNYVKVEPGDIREIQVRNAVGELHAVRDESGWTLSDLEESQLTDSDGIEEWLREVASLRLLRPVTADASALPDGGREIARISWTLQSQDETIGGGYALYRLDDDRVLAKSDSSPFLVEVSRSSVEPLLEIDRENMLRDLAAAAEDPAPPAPE